MNTSQRQAPKRVFFINSDEFPVSHKAGGYRQVSIDERITLASVSRPVVGFAWGISQSVAVMTDKAEWLAV
ncbi:hypothetical protein [Cernens ardua]|uniref:hypothetical protein n=1 Tax=Cernens ardua TaxID=3402176 RepID=UPI003F9D2B9D